MSQPFVSNHYVDVDGRPAGGDSRSTGVDITWQNGPLGRGEDRQAPNGAFVETVIAIAVDRIKFYQDDTQFSCRENALAITKLEEAIHWLNARTARRELQGAEGTYEGN